MLENCSWAARSSQTCARVGCTGGEGCQRSAKKRCSALAIFPGSQRLLFLVSENSLDPFSQLSAHLLTCVPVPSQAKGKSENIKTGVWRGEKNSQ